jgi:hypothetical protein
LARGEIKWASAINDFTDQTEEETNNHFGVNVPMDFGPDQGGDLFY